MHTRRASLILPLVLAAVGCTDYASAGRYGKGLVLVLPGIEGRGVFNQQIVDGLGQAGVPYALEIYDWTSGVTIGFLAHLMDYKHNRQEARRIAWRLVTYRHNFPGRPIWLVGQSGGGGVLVLALEELPKGFQVDGAVLLAPALSQEYNLGPALRHCRGPMYHYYSPNDAFFLGMGTELFGTIDRKYESAAGRRGFQKSLRLSAGDAALYNTRLHQVDCSTPGNSPGHVGLHLTSSSPRFIAKVVAPIIWRAPARSAQRVPRRTASPWRYRTVLGPGHTPPAASPTAPNRSRAPSPTRPHWTVPTSPRRSR